MATLKRKIERHFFEKKVSPGYAVEQFIGELDTVLQTIHDTSMNKHQYQHQQQPQEGRPIIPYDDFLTTIQSQSRPAFTTCTNDHSIILTRNKKKKRNINYGRIVKRLKNKLRSSNILIRRTDKSKVFHLGKAQDYRMKPEIYMEKTAVYECLGDKDPLPDLIDRTNRYLLNLRLAHWITQKQYEQLVVKSDEVQLAHLYYLPKAHKPGTPLRPIISGIKHPTVKISKYLDRLLRPLFNRIASKTTVTCGFQVLQQLNAWSTGNLCSTILLGTMDVIDLYTMIQQTEGIQAIRKMLDELKLKEIGGLKSEIIIRLCRFVVQNNYFTYDGKFYHQIRGGAMGSPLTLTIANCYMFFFEKDIVKQINNAGGVYVRYIDDILIAVNWPDRHLQKQVAKWNMIDSNIKLNVQTGYSVNFLDLYILNINGHMFTKVFHKPSYEPYFLPFNSMHPMHMKKNIPYEMLFRGIKYCPTFEAYINEREKLRMSLLLNKYPGDFIDKQFDRLRQKIIHSPMKEKMTVDFGRSMFIYFTFCANMKSFPPKFHTFWNKYFAESHINEIKPILSARNVDNLQQQLVFNR